MITSVVLGLGLLAGGTGGVEVAASRAAVVSRYDADGDGRICEAEGAAARRSMKVLREASMQSFDKDGDGRLSPVEKEIMFQTMMLERFRNLEKPPRVGVAIPPGGGAPAATNSASKAAGVAR